MRTEPATFLRTRQVRLSRQAQYPGNLRSLPPSVVCLTEGRSLAHANLPPPFGLRPPCLRASPTEYQ